MFGSRGVRGVWVVVVVADEVVVEFVVGLGSEVEDGSAEREDDMFLWSFF